MAELGLNDNSTTAAALPRAQPSASAQQARFGATAVLYTIVIIAVLVMVNWLANRYNKSYDTTSNKRFTLSQETKKIVKGLNSNATITYIDESDKFSQAKGMLERYANLSPKIRVQYIDPKRQTTLTRSYA